MSSLWTPGGEHSVPPSPPPPDRPAPRGPEDVEPSEEEVAQALGEMRTRIAATPVVDIITEHAAALLELAVLHLGLDADAGTSSRHRPNLGEASLAIDAMAGLVEGLGPRLGPHAGHLAAALASLRLAFVRESGDGSGRPG